MHEFVTNRIDAKLLKILFGWYNLPTKIQADHGSCIDRCHRDSCSLAFTAGANWKII